MTSINKDQLAIHDLIKEIGEARTKFPLNTNLMLALTEEVGELAKAQLDESSTNVYKEAIQVACLAIRIATESDASLAQYRQSKGLDQ